MKRFTTIAAAMFAALLIACPCWAGETKEHPLKELATFLVNRPCPGPKILGRNMLAKSAEYFADEQDAVHALASGEWTQRPVN